MRSLPRRSPIDKFYSAGEPEQFIREDRPGRAI